MTTSRFDPKWAVTVTMARPKPSPELLWWSVPRQGIAPPKAEQSAASTIRSMTSFGIRGSNFLANLGVDSSPMWLEANPRLTPCPNSAVRKGFPQKSCGQRMLSTTIHRLGSVKLSLRRRPYAGSPKRQSAGKSAFSAATHRWTCSTTFGSDAATIGLSASPNSNDSAVTVMAIACG